MSKRTVKKTMSIGALLSIAFVSLFIISGVFESPKYLEPWQKATSGIIMQGLVTVFPSLNSGKAASDTFIQSTRTSVDNTAAYAIIISNDNNRTSRVKSGMLYSRLIRQLIVWV